MKQNKLMRLQSLLVVLLTMFSMSAFAGNDKYYSKAVAKAVGEGKVYVNYNSESSDLQYAGTSEATSGGQSNSLSSYHTYYMYAQANEGYVFDGWYSEEECITQKSKENPYKVAVSSPTTTENSPQTATYYALFVKNDLPRYSKATAKAVGGGQVYVSYGAKTDAPEYAAESEAESGLQTHKEHIYYLYADTVGRYKFLGWYANEACTGTALSTEPVYEITIAADKENEDAPTTKNYYAKFEYNFTISQSRLYLNVDDEPAANESISVYEGAELTYESSNADVVTVDADGVVTPVRAGSAVITVSDDQESLTYIVTVVDYTEAGITQIGNSDFEDWRGVTSSNHAPDNWNSFETNEGSYASLASSQQVQMVEDHRPGSDGLYCADIWSRTVFGVVAQGNLTTGCINAGAMSASAAGNYNYSKTSDPKKSETLSRVPSAIRLWVKFVPAAANAEHPNAHVAVVVHGDGDYITYSSDDYDNDDNRGLAIAKAEYDFPSTNGEWTELTIPFEPTGNTTDGQMYILVNIATNADPGQGQAGDHLYVDDIELIYTETYDKYVSVSYSTPVEASIEVTEYKDDIIDFNLKNFILSDGTNQMYVGNVAVPNLEIDNQGNFSYDGIIQIEAGDKEGVDMWVGPALGDIPLTMEGTIKGDYFYVHLNINIPGAPVQVEVGDVANATFKVGESLIGTFCAPFTVALPEQYLQYVSTVTGVEEKGVLTLTPIETPVVLANTPVVVQIPMAMELPVSGIYVKGTPTVGLLTGVYEDTPAPVGSYVLQNNDGRIGFYQVAEGQQPTVKANRCYLTAPAAGVKAFFFNADDATGINEELKMKNEASATEVFNLAGQRLGKMQKGINIVNGKKVLVK